MTPHKSNNVNKGLLYGLATIILIIGITLMELENVTNHGKFFIGLFIVLLGLVKFWRIGNDTTK